LSQLYGPALAAIEKVARALAQHRFVVTDLAGRRTYALAQ
jgi:hypothetical protein